MTKHLQMLSTLTASGAAELSLVEKAIPEPGDGEVVVKMEAAPINPSDMWPLLGPADYSKGKLVGEGGQSKMTAPIAEAHLDVVRSRLDQPMPVGNEGAGVVVAAGKGAQELDGRLVSLVSGQCYAQYVRAPMAMCLAHKDGTTAEQAASSFVNPMTAQCFLETMRLEGHEALVHTAAASNLGQMLVKLCAADGVPLVNIIRKEEQAKLLRDLGAEHIVNSESKTFRAELIDAIAATKASLAYEAIGAGSMADTILDCMERAFSRDAQGLNTYGSDKHKQVYIYGRLQTGATTLGLSYGMQWGVGGWLLTPTLQRIGMERAAALQKRVAENITGIFASQYAHELSLGEALEPTNIARYMARQTGEKFLIKPQKGL